VGVGHRRRRHYRHALAHNGSSSTASARHDSYVAVSDIAPLSIAGAGSLSLAWSEAATHTGTQVHALVRVNGVW
jgi:hypothetical protein